MKKILTIGLLLILASSLFAEGDSQAVENGKVLTIYAWNTEFQDRFNAFFADKMPEGVTVNWVITPNQDNAYQNKLDDALLMQSSATADDKIDIFLVEADYALKYVDTDYTLDVKKIGLTNADIANQYKYTKDIMTDSKGVLKGVSWQACPAGYMYRRSIMKDVIGTDDPAKVQEAISSWDKFDAVAAKAKAKGYFMVSGYDDSFRVFSDNMKSPWVVNGKIKIDSQIEKWIDQTKMYTEKGYNNKANLWSAEMFSQMGKNGKVVGYFGPGWFVDFVLKPNTKADAEGPNAVGNGSYGDWGLVKGPQGFSWGGTWICGAAGTDNIQLVKDVMYTLTCDTAVLKAIATELGDFTNNAKAMEEIANSDYSYDFLGGQNHIAVFLDSAMSIDRSNISPYDQGMSEKIQLAFSDYFNGTITKDQAWNNFYKAVLELYPELKK
ncbi:MAG: carbohydrate ABC transporter substrate-binding protein [Spirochaetales bacterium]|nr:carbohydrate ABC transporter substrate-binding protein [Spirochaetales bacterium]